MPKKGTAECAVPFLLQTLAVVLTVLRRVLTVLRILLVLLVVLSVIVAVLAVLILILILVLVVLHIFSPLQFENCKYSMTHTRGKYTTLALVF